MDKDLTIDVSKIHLKDIKIISANLESVGSSPAEDFNVSILGNTKVTINNLIVQIILTIDINSENNDHKCQFKIGFAFTCEDLKLHTEFSEDKQSIKLNPDLESILFSISFSTARGIIFTRCQGTAFEGSILPIIKPITALNSRAKFVKEQLSPENPQNTKKTTT